MRIIVTFILVNLMTTGIHETIYVSEPLGTENSLIFSKINRLTNFKKENNSEKFLNSAQQLTNEFPSNDEMISIKILNESGEVINKWQGKSRKVLANTISFLEKATVGLYKINGILIDGSESSFLLKK